MTASGVLRAAVAVVALLVGACAPGTSTPDPVASGVEPTPLTSGEATGGHVRIILGIYSGRPDPEWTLTADQLVVLEAELAMLPDTTGTPPSAGLGYHGFTVVRPGGSIVAYRGTVAEPGTDPRPYKLDPGRVVERLLLESGRPHLTPQEIAEVEKALRQ